MSRNIEGIMNEEKKREAEKLFDILKDKLDENTQNLPELLAEYMQNKNGKYIVFCKNIEDMKEKIEQANKMFGDVNKNIKIYDVSSERTLKQNEKTLNEFEKDENEDSLKLLYSVNMINEGYHVEGINGVIMMRPTYSPNVFIQQLGRALTTKKEGGEPPVIIDLVNNFDTCKIIEDFCERMKQYEVGEKKEKNNLETKSKLTIFDKTKEFREIAQKITNLTKSKIFIEDKIKLLEEFCEKGEQLTAKTTYQGYPIGTWAIQIRSYINNDRNGENLSINLSEEQYERLEKLGIFERKIDSTIDEKIEELVEWNNIYPKAKISAKNGVLDILKEYSNSEEEYTKMVNKYEKMRQYYEYVRTRRSRGKLTEEQELKCKEGNVRGVFGFPTKVEELAKQYNQEEEKISYILNNYGEIDNFLDLYRNNELIDKELLLAKKMIINEADIDLNSNRECYNMLLEKIFDTFNQTQENTDFRMYSTEKINEIIEEVLPVRARFVIQERYGLISGQKKTIEQVGKEIDLRKRRSTQHRTKSTKNVKEGI